MEIKLWTINDVRTQFRTYLEMFRLDNTKRAVKLPVYHAAVKRDRYFNNVKVEQHMRQIFSDFELFEAPVPNHAPTVIADEKQATDFIPLSLRRRVFGKNTPKN